MNNLNHTYNLLITNPKMAEASVGFLPRILELGEVKSYIQYLKNNDFLNFYLQKDITTQYLNSTYRQNDLDVLISNTLYDSLFCSARQKFEEKQLDELATKPYIKNSEGSILTQLVKIEQGDFYQRVETLLGKSYKINESIFLATIDFDHNDSFLFPEKIIQAIKNDYQVCKNENNINRFLESYDFSVLFNSNVASFILNSLIEDGKLNSYIEKLHKLRGDFVNSVSKFDNDWHNYPSQLIAFLFLLQNDNVDVNLFEKILHNFDNHPIREILLGKILEYSNTGDNQDFITQVMDSDKTPSLIQYFNIDKNYLKRAYVEFFNQDYEYLQHYFSVINKIYPDEKLFELKHLIPSILKSDDFFEKNASEKFLLFLENVFFKIEDTKVIYSNVIKFLNHQPIQNERTNLLRETLEKQYLDLAQENVKETPSRKMKI